MNLKELARHIASAAHSGQLDKGGREYIDHPIQVASAFDSDIYYAAAMLHDVVEDTGTTLADLLHHGIPEIVVDAVDAITKRKGEDYYEYLSRVKANPVARAVKLQDLKHNMQLERIPDPTEKDYSRMEKYKKAYDYLSD